MQKSKPTSQCSVAHLGNRIAFNVMLDEFAIAALSDAAAALREANDPTATSFEDTIRTHRIGILKQRAILGAAGIDV